jgi:hypothetical protein
VQVESGVEYSRTSIGGSPAERRFSLDVTLRGGVTEHLELRLDGEPVVVTRGGQHDTGWGDVSLAAKYRFFGLIGLASFTLPWGFGLDANLGVNASAQRPRRGYIPQGLASASLDHDVGERWSVYGEVFFASATDYSIRAGLSVRFGR